MSTRDDDLTTRELPERLFYAPGVFLDAEDLLAEQLYHRGRLTRVLGYLHGSGTVSGLRVQWDATALELQVLPGLAVDRLGRLVEIPRRACVRLPDWLDYQRQQALEAGSGVAHPLVLSTSLDGTSLVFDVFLRFVVCERGRTPAFATGPYDAIDASQPHRLRDSYELTLELRGRDAGLPSNPWPARTTGQSMEDYLAAVRDHVLDHTWQHDVEWPGGVLPADDGTEGVSDPTGVLLARVTLPVELDTDGIPQWRQTAGVLDPPSLDNHVRSFVLPSPALVRLIEAAQE
jgi:hypothetical protein